MSDLEHDLALRAQREQAKRDIIDSSLDDVPPPGGKAQLLAALNLAASDGKTAAEAPRSRPFGGSAAYIVGLALVVGAGAAFLSSSTAEGPHVGPAASTSEAAATQVVAPLGEPGPPTALVAPPEKEAASSSPANLPVAEPAPVPSSNVRAARSAPLTKARSESTLGREVARMTAARSALAAGDTARTLELLDSYESEFPHGAFSVEVSVLRVESLARSGRMDEARRVGERFLKEHPHGLPASRVAATLGIPSAPEAEPAPAPIR